MEFNIVHTNTRNLYRWTSAVLSSDMRDCCICESVFYCPNTERASRLFRSQHVLRSNPLVKLVLCQKAQFNSCGLQCWTLFMCRLRYSGSFIITWQEKMTESGHLKWCIKHLHNMQSSWNITTFTLLPSYYCEFSSFLLYRNQKISLTITD